METSKWKRHEPEEPEHLTCEQCCKEIPPSSGHSAEGRDYIYHFCGVDCLDQWKDKQRREEEGPADHPEEV